MEAEKVEALKLKIENEWSMDGEHIAIQNINQRIKLFFGSQYGLNISSNLAD